VIDPRGVLPGVDHVVNDILHTMTMFDLCENNRARSAHFLRILFHDFEVGPHCRREIRFVDHKEVGLGDAWAPFARNFITAGDINDLDGVIGQLTTETGSEIVATRLNQEELRFKLAVEFFESEQVRRNILTDRSVRAAASFHRANAFGGQGVVPGEELSVLTRENIIRDRGDIILFAHAQAKLEHKSGFAATNRATNADSECTLRKIPVERKLPFVEVTWMLEMFVGMAVSAMIMLVGVRVAHEIQL
jgi:hypothetical protein